MQATDLGSYVLYRHDGTFAGPNGSSSAPVEWVADDAGALTAGTRKAGPVTPDPGCAAYPEADLDATGTPPRGATPFGKGSGPIDGPQHWITKQEFGRAAP